MSDEWSKDRPKDCGETYKEERGPVQQLRDESMKGKEEPLEVQPPEEYGTPYVSLAQAAFIMQEPEEVLIDWIKKGLLLAFKVGNKEFPNFYQIHQSELNRFRHPWKHIWRLDERITCLQKLLDIFKHKINMGQTAQQRLDAFASRLSEMQYQSGKHTELTKQILDVFNESLAEMKKRVDIIYSYVVMPPTTKKKATAKKSKKKVAPVAKKRK